MRGKFLQGFFLVLVDVAPDVLGKPEYKKPSAPLVGRNQGAISAALSLTRTGNALLQQPATQIRFIQSTGRRLSAIAAVRVRNQSAIWSVTGFSVNRSFVGQSPDTTRPTSMK